MVKLAILVLALAAFANAQNRPFYASRPVGVPEMLDQFKPTDGVGNRIGDDDEDKAPLKPEEGIMGDPYLTPRLQDFPREHQPFWYINSKHIMEHRGQRVPEAKPAEVETPVVADPTERRPQPPRRRPAQGPVRPQTPEFEDLSERRQEARPQPARRRPAKIPPKPVEPEYEEITERRSRTRYEDTPRPGNTVFRKERPFQN